MQFFYTFNDILMLSCFRFQGQNATVAVMSYSGYDIEVMSINKLKYVFLPCYSKFCMHRPKQCTLIWLFNAVVIDNKDVDQSTLDMILCLCFRTP